MKGFTFKAQCAHLEVSRGAHIKLKDEKIDHLYELQVQPL